MDLGTNGGILSQRQHSDSPTLGSISCKNQKTKHFFFSGVLYPTEPNSWTIHIQLSLHLSTLLLKSICGMGVQLNTFKTMVPHGNPSNSNHIAKPTEFTPFNLLHDTPKNKACCLCFVLSRGYKSAFWAIRPHLQRDLIYKDLTLLTYWQAQCLTARFW